MSAAEEIAQLEAVLQKLVSGEAVAEAEYGGRRVRYQAGNIEQLRDLIAQKKSAAGLGGRSPARTVLF